MRRLKEQLFYNIRMLWHPIDAFYELKYLGAGSALSATLLIIIAFACNIAVLGLTNFVFNVDGLTNTGIPQLLVSTMVPFFLWVLANYLVSSIMKGDGRLIDIYITAAYCLVPYILFALPLAVLSNVMTKAEQSIYDFLSMGIYCWMIFLCFLHVKEVHTYEIFETIKNILWILFTMVMAVIFALALFGITVQAINLIIGIFREVIGNV